MTKDFLKKFIILGACGLLAVQPALTPMVASAKPNPIIKEKGDKDKLNLTTVDLTENGVLSANYMTIENGSKYAFSMFSPEDTIKYLMSVQPMDENGLVIINLTDEEKANYNVETSYTEAGLRMVTVTSKNVKSNKKVVYMLHGGAGSMSFNWSNYGNYSKNLADKGYTVKVPDYHVTTETKDDGTAYNHKDMLEEAITGYKELLKTVKPKDIIVAGDSFGGGLALALCQSIKNQKIDPKAYVLISPWTNLAGDTESNRTNFGVDVMFSNETLKVAAEMYAAGDDLKNPLISPYYGDYTGVKSDFFMVTSNAEVMEDDAVDVAEKLKKQGVKEVEVVVFEKVLHAAPLHVNTGIYECDQAFSYVGNYYDSLVGPKHK